MRYLSKIIGYSKNFTSALKRFIRRKPVDSIQAANRVSLLSFAKKSRNDAFHGENLSEMNPYLPQNLCANTIHCAMKNNTLKVKKDFYGVYQFMEGDKNVGYASLYKYKKHYAPKGIYPQNWYIEDAVPNERGFYPIKPFLRIDEFAMNDRLGKPVLEKRDKKYGTMAMQHIIKYSYETECEGRVLVEAGPLGGTGFEPGKFYNKVGFEPIPKTVRKLIRLETKFYREFDKLIASGKTEEEAISILEQRGITLPEKNGNVFVPGSGYLFMVHPEKTFNIK